MSEGELAVVSKSIRPELLCGNNCSIDCVGSIFFFSPSLFFKGELMWSELSFLAPYLPLRGSLLQRLMGSDWTTRWSCLYQVQAPRNQVKNSPKATQPRMRAMSVSHTHTKAPLHLFKSKNCYVNRVVHLRL